MESMEELSPLDQPPTPLTTTPRTLSLKLNLINTSKGNINDHVYKHILASIGLDSPTTS